MAASDRITFGGGGLDRAAALRGDSRAVAALAARPGARVLPLWRGRMLLSGEGLVALPFDHPALAGATPAEEAETVLLGRCAAGEGIWARPLSDWDGAPQETAPGEEVAHPAIGGAAFAELRGRMAGLGAREAELAAMGRAVLNWHDAHRFCARCGAPSHVAEAGWRRACPACGAQHFPRTDPVVIMLVTHGDAVLLGRAPGWPEAMHSVLAGFVEPGETAEAAVRREVAEEVGVTVGPVDYVASQPWPFPASLMLGFHARVTGPERPVLRPDPAEIAAAHWVPRQRLARIFAGEDHAIRAPLRGAIARHLMWNWLAGRLD
ncbi:NAD(+) diphosphatase [Limimaricola hongkongensis]|uniref:NAD(+) diphosphatase n=1 Tax=Limimaricola hongkongensis DSM 17492 TaxID=1122180 RepID=A0A017HDN8_9RHOB|nr:NAD(+) diphosphatase [Limimaricola hongkongensis]EYD72592.1 NADH pyrophosphatase [Limimaricola hongkongensis DSM 17492]